MEDPALMSDRAVALLEQILELQQEQLDVVKADAELRKRAIRLQQIYMRVWFVVVAFIMLAFLLAPIVLRWILVEASQ